MTQMRAGDGLHSPSPNIVSLFLSENPLYLRRPDSIIDFRSSNPLPGCLNTTAAAKGDDGGQHQQLQLPMPTEEPFRG